MFQIARRHLVWFTGLTCDDLSKCKIGNTKTKKKTVCNLRLGAFGPSNNNENIMNVSKCMCFI